jgi:hypothetical protein
MRIKLRCPHCGDWFTLNLGVENGEAETRQSDEHAEGAEADDEPARPRGGASRARLIGAISVVAAAVIIVWAIVALRSDGVPEGGVPDQVSARPSAARAEPDEGRDDFDEMDVAEAAPPAVDASSDHSAGGRPDERGGAAARGADDAAVEGEQAGHAGEAARTREPAGGTDEPGDDEPAVSAADEPGLEREVVGGDEFGAGDGDTPPADADVAGTEPGAVADASADAPGVHAATTDQESSESAPRASLEREILELVIVASSRCWIRVEADGVVVADATLDAGDRRSWRADGFFEVDVGAGNAVRLYLNGRDLGTAGADARVVEGLRVTTDGVRGR